MYHSLHNPLHSTDITQPTQHMIHTIATHTTTIKYNNHPLHKITCSCRHTCRSNAVTCRSQAGTIQSSFILIQFSCILVHIPCGCTQTHVAFTPISLIFLRITHLIQGYRLFLPTFHHFKAFCFDRLCMHMT